MAAKINEEISKSFSAPAPIVTALAPEPEPETNLVKRLNPIKLKQLENRLKFTEEEIPRVEQEIAAAEERLGNFVSAEQSQKDAVELDSLREQRQSLLTEWEELSLTLEEQRA